MNRRALLAALAASAASSVAGCADGFDALESGRSDREPYGVDDDEYVDPDDDGEERDDEDRQLHVGVFVGSLLDDVQEFHFEADHIPEENDELVLEFDIGVLTEYGVAVDTPELDVEFVRGRAGSDDLEAEVTSYEEGVLEVTVTTSDERGVRGAFSLTGLDASEAGDATGLEYELSVPDREADAAVENSFDIVDLDERQPTVGPESMWADHYRQQVRMGWIQPDADALHLEIDVSALEEYASLAEAAVDGTRLRGGAIEEATLEQGVVSLELVPEPDTRIVSGEFWLVGIDVTVEESVEDVVYEASLEGAVLTEVDVDPFDIRDGEGVGVDDEDAEDDEDTEDE